MLINIEGTDSSGKETQTKRLYQKLSQKGMKTIKISFPDYDSPSSELVKMYLNGDFGDKPEDVTAEVASIFYACDRFASFKTKWKKYYEENYIIVSDRYTTSNIIHQASKLDTIKEKEEYIAWLENLEYNIFKIPRPDLTIFLNMPFENSQKLMENRLNKFSGEKSKDIHESDKEYLKKAYISSMDICDSLGWSKVDCINQNGDLKSLEEISQEIFKLVEELYNDRFKKLDQ